MSVPSGTSSLALGFSTSADHQRGIRYSISTGKNAGPRHHRTGGADAAAGASKLELDFVQDLTWKTGEQG
jgi:hypothetical protein